MTSAAITVFRVILDTLRHYLTRPSWLSEVASGIATLSWGLLAIEVVDKTDVNWPSVDLFFSISESPIWGLIAILVGVGQIGLFQLIDKEWRKPWLRFGTAMIACWLWGTISYSAVRVQPWPPGAGAYFGWWFVNVYLISRIFWTR